MTRAVSYITGWSIEQTRLNEVKPIREGDEILWPPLYTVKWTREHIPIVFFTERHHSERSGVGLTGAYETPRIAQAEFRFEWPNSILVRWALEATHEFWHGNFI